MVVDPLGNNRSIFLSDAKKLLSAVVTSASIGD